MNRSKWYNTWRSSLVAAGVLSAVILAVQVHAEAQNRPDDRPSIQLKTPWVDKGWHKVGQPLADSLAESGAPRADTRRWERCLTDWHQNKPEEGTQILCPDGYHQYFIPPKPDLEPGEVIASSGKVRRIGGKLDDCLFLTYEEAYGFSADPGDGEFFCPR